VEPNRVRDPSFEEWPRGPRKIKKFGINCALTSTAIRKIFGLNVSVLSTPFMLLGRENLCPSAAPCISIPFIVEKRQNYDTACVLLHNLKQVINSQCPGGENRDIKFKEKREITLFLLIHLQVEQEVF